MARVKDWLVNMMTIVHSVKDEKLKWRKENQALQTDLKRDRILSEKSLTAELKKRSVQLEHDILLLKTRHATELAMFKTKCKQDIKDYKQYLESLEQLKHSIQNSYTHLPEAVAFTIHHHAKHLLNEMWEAQELEEKMQREIRLIRFMSTVHEDARAYLEGKTTENLPERTLELIKISD